VPAGLVTVAMEEAVMPGGLHEVLVSLVVEEGFENSVLVHRGCPSWVLSFDTHMVRP
jgi:hypothetical protein